MQEQYWVWMSQALGAGSYRTDRILSQFGGAREFYEAGEEGLRRTDLKEKERAALRKFPMLRAMEICESAQKLGMRLLTPESPEYPQRLREIPGMPLVLFVRGSLEGLDDTAAVGVVGTRRSSEYGRTVARRISRDMARAGAIVVSGMALGIDTQAHLGALEGKGRTIAVLGCGLDICYPPQNRELMERIAKTGAVISEYAPATPPASFHFPQRNRIIAGLSLGVLMVEADYGSGALLTVRDAMEQGKDIFTIPHGLYDPHAAVSLALIRDGVIPVGCARHILEEYEPRFPGTIELSRLEKSARPKEGGQTREDPKARTETGKSPAEPEAGVPAAQAERGAARKTHTTAQPQTGTARENPRGKAPEISEQAQRVLRELGSEAKSINELAAQIGMDIPQLLGAATELELCGMAQLLPGRRVKRT